MRSVFFVTALAVASAACGRDMLHVERPPAPPFEDIHSFAHGCFTMDAAEPGSTNTRWLTQDIDGAGFAFVATDPAEAALLRVQAADLGTYLLYDQDGQFVVFDAPETEEGEDPAPPMLLRRGELDSDLMLLDDSFVSPAEWDFEVAAADESRLQLRHRATGEYLGADGALVSAADAATISFYPAEGCAPFPEASLDAEPDDPEQRVDASPWDDGDVFGFVETHAHLFTNFGFGGAGMFHGSPYHRLGVEYALPACTRFHGAQGRRDLIAFAFGGLGGDIDTDTLVTAFVTGRTPEPQHATDGWPTFTDWPNAWKHSTHQVQYHRWIERAYLAGLRLLVQDATTNSVLCEMLSGIRAQPTRYSCNDMIAVDRQIEETYLLERYIDAQAGGRGRGWFRVVDSPAEARRVIAEGKLAVVLGIETSNLFDCFLTPREGFPTCDADYVRAELDRYYERGVRVLFPVHKFDNAFSSGDGDRNVGQIGSFINSGHWSNFTLGCPESHAHFDRGNVVFGGLNMPRASYDEPAPNDTSGFGAAPVSTLLPFLDLLSEPALEGDYCQATGLTELGETLIEEMMLRGMILEVDHLPRRSYNRAFEILVENDYPAVGSHGSNNGGELYALGGVSKTGFGGCGNGEPGGMVQRFRDRIEQVRAQGAYPAEGFGFDFNGFAGSRRPRFGDESGCGSPQENPVEYPFRSYRGDVTFTEPALGDREVDFDTEGMLHLGLVAELIEDVRRDGATDEDLEPLFRSAEGYLRMWERAEARAAELRGD